MTCCYRRLNRRNILEPIGMGRLSDTMQNTLPPYTASCSLKHTYADTSIRFLSLKNNYCLCNKDVTLLLFGPSPLLSRMTALVWKYKISETSIGNPVMRFNVNQWHLKAPNNERNSESEGPASVNRTSITEMMGIVGKELCKGYAWSYITQLLLQSVRQSGYSEIFFSEMELTKLIWSFQVGGHDKK